jgi:hypothetical protein
MFINVEMHLDKAHSIISNLLLNIISQKLQITVFLEQTNDEDVLQRED